MEGKAQPGCPVEPLESDSGDPQPPCLVWELGGYSKERAMPRAAPASPRGRDETPVSTCAAVSGRQSLRKGEKQHLCTLGFCCQEEITILRGRCCLCAGLSLLHT